MIQNTFEPYVFLLHVGHSSNSEPTPNSDHHAQPIIVSSMSGLFPKQHTRFLPEFLERGSVWNWFIKFVSIPLLLICALLAHSALVNSGETKNGFDVTQHSVPLQHILSGGPPRDGIPAIMKPNFGLVETSVFSSGRRPNTRYRG